MVPGKEMNGLTHAPPTICELTKKLITSLGKRKREQPEDLVP